MRGCCPHVHTGVCLHPATVCSKSDLEARQECVHGRLVSSTAHVQWPGPGALHAYRCADALAFKQICFPDAGAFVCKHMLEFPDLLRVDRRDTTCWGAQLPTTRHDTLSRCTMSVT